MSQKQSFRNIKQTISVDTVNVLPLGADHLTSEGGGGGVGDFEKKYPASAYA